MREGERRGEKGREKNGERGEGKKPHTIYATHWLFFCSSFASFLKWYI